MKLCDVILSVILIIIKILFKSLSENKMMKLIRFFYLKIDYFQFMSFQDMISPRPDMRSRRFSPRDLVPAWT